MKHREGGISKATNLHAEDVDRVITAVFATVAHAEYAIDVGGKVGSFVQLHTSN